MVVDWEPAIRALLDDRGHKVAGGVMAARFHNLLANTLLAIAQRCNQSKVVLSGGCFQNRYLTERVTRHLLAADFQPYWHQRVPPNDGGIALGQLWLATSPIRELAILVYGEIVEVFSEEGILFGGFGVHGATKKIPLGLLTDAAQGDRVLICDGVAISKVADSSEKETNHVLGDTRKLIETSTDVNGVRMGKANFGGIVKQVCLEYTPEVEKGDYVLVHVGFALRAK